VADHGELIPPHCDRLPHVAQLTLPLLLPEPVEPPALLELEELLQATVISAVVATTAPAAITCRARKIPFQANCWLDKLRSCIAKLNGRCPRKERQAAFAGQVGVFSL